MIHTVEQAQALQQQGLHQEAIKIYEKLLHLDPMQMDILGYLGAAYTALGDRQQAKGVLHRVLALNAKNAKAHNNLAGMYAADQNYLNALRHYRDAVHSEPGFVLAHFNLGLLLLNHQELEAAEIQFKNVLALDAHYPSALFYLGLLFLKSERFDEAEAMFQQLVIMAPEHVEGWVNRGVVALKQGKEQQAVDYFTQALLLDNHHLEARNNLAATFIHFDRYEAALQYYAELLRDDPNSLEYLYNAGVAEMGLGHLTSAQALFNRVLGIEANHFGALSNLAAIHMRSGQRLTACELLERALAVKPEDQTSYFMLQALKGKSQQGACPQYAKDLFNHYALYYDAHMEQQLQYAVPKRLWSLFHERQDLACERALDLGCGTGLAGRVLRPFVKKLIGIDLSSKMLAIAKPKGLYDELIESELLTYLQHQPGKFDCVVAADVLPYLGDLQPLWEALVACLAPKATFWFTTEISQKEPWTLQESMRFCHHPEYIQTLCSQYGLTVIHQETLAARKQDSNDLWVNFFGVSGLSASP